MHPRRQGIEEGKQGKLRKYGKQGKQGKQGKRGKEGKQGKQGNKAKSKQGDKETKHIWPGGMSGAPESGAPLATASRQAP